MWVLAKEGKAICLGALITRTLQVHYSLRFAAKTKTGGNKYIVVIHVHEHSNLAVVPRARPPSQSKVKGHSVLSWRSMGASYFMHVFFPSFLTDRYMGWCRAHGCLLDTVLYVICNPLGHCLTCWLCIPRGQCVYKTSELQETAGIESWENVPPSWIDHSRHSFSLIHGGHPVPALSWPPGTCPGSRPDLYLAWSTKASAGGRCRTVSACMHTSSSCTIMVHKRIWIMYQRVVPLQDPAS